jgi:type VI secretion system protein ImpK
MTSTTTVRPQLLLPPGEINLSTHLFSKDRGYYRSKVFNTTIGINALIAAASPLFSLACFLSENTQQVDPYTLYQDLQHEIKAFENHAKQQHYRSETILVTRYLLCAFLDEIIQYSPWGKTIDWSAYSLLVFFHQEHSGEERFFAILDRLSHDPELHVDLLELIYLCLALGFYGKYRHDPENKQHIEKITLRLFECIRHERIDLKKEIHISPQEEIRPVPAKFQFPLWLVASFTLALLLTTYSGFSYMLSNNAQTLYQQINTLTNPTHEMA